MRIRKCDETTPWKPASVLFTRPTMAVTYSFHRFRECALDFHNSRISADVQPKHISQAYKEFRVIPCSCYLFTRQWFLIFATQAGRIQETRNLVSLFVSRNFFFTNPSSWIFIYIYKNEKHIHVGKRRGEIRWSSKKIWKIRFESKMVTTCCFANQQVSRLNWNIGRSKYRGRVEFSRENFSDISPPSIIL